MDKLRDNLKTQLEYFYKWEKEKPNKVFLRQPYGDTWKTLTYQQAGEEARRMTTALQGLGLKKGAHISIISKNCYHWVLADLAIMMGGYVSTPFYANLAPDTLTEVIKKSDTKAIFVGKLDEYKHMSQGIPAGMPVIRFPHYPGNAEVTQGLNWDDLVKNNEPMQGEPLPKLSDLWTLIFTSGTTGSPKGVVHDYENPALLIRSEQINNSLKVYSTDDPSFFSFLPLNHIAERIAVEVSCLMSGGRISFAESLDTFAKNLQETQPTLFFAVPRIWTKFYLGVLGKMPQKKLDLYLKIPILSGIVKKKIKQNLGLTNANTTLTGASITPESLKQWYRKLGINLREVYGMTENCGGFTLMPENGHKPNTVGKPVPFAEGRIEPDTGEILMKMPWMMKGYYKEAEKTAEVLINDWLHTGDKGLIDEDGYFKIIGRVKDAFKTAKGKYIVPTNIEKHFDHECIEQICVCGLGMPQPLAMVVLSEIGQAKDKNEVTETLKAQLAEANKSLHGHERVSTIVVAKEAWTPENQILTPTLKVRRGAVDERYLERMESWHEAKDAVVWE